MQRPTDSIRFLSCFVPIGVASILLHNGNALASTCRTISSSQAEGLEGTLVDLKIGPGFGLNILVPEEETVENIWLDDMSQIGVASNGKLCQLDRNQSDCQTEGASVLHLRQIEKINFPNLPRSADGSTLLTLIPEGAARRKIYHFKVTATSKSPDYQCVVIQPDSGKSNPMASQLPVENRANTASITEQESPTATLPIAQQEFNPSNLSTLTPESNQLNSNLIKSDRAILTVPPQNRENLQNSLPKRAITSTVTPVIQEPLDNVAAAQKGLKVAKRIGFYLKLKPQLRAIKAIDYLQQGLSIEAAAEKSGLHVTLLNQLIKWGRTYEQNLVSSY